MRPFGWVLVVVAAGAVCRGADDDAARMRRLVGRLASPDFQEREAAGRELDRLGDGALAPLREAVSNGDPETRRRAPALLDRIGRRLTATRILAPTFVSLNYDKMPLTAVIADLSRRTGMPIALHGEARTLDGRTVTLMAEKITVWQAVQLVCHRAGLHEWDGLSPGPGAVAAGSGVGVERPDGVLVLGQMQVRRGQVNPVTVPLPATRLTLVDGPGRALPVHHAGAVRVRVVPPGVTFPGELGKEPVVELQVTAEDRLQVDGATDLRIERAIDEQGRERHGRPVWPEPPDPTDDWPRGARIPPQLTERKHGPVAIRFARDDAPPRRLRELSGTVTVLAYAAEPMLAFDGPAEAMGKTLRQGDVAVSLVNWSPLAAGEIRVVVEMQLPYGTRLDQPVGGASWGAGRGGRFAGPWGGIQPGEPDPVAASGFEYQGVSIFDSVGRRFSPETGTTCLVGLFPQHFTIRVGAKYRPPAAGAEAVRVGFAARSLATVEVPFLLRDVPLP